MAKIERKYLMHFINVTPDKEPTYEPLGKDLEEFTVEMSAQVEKKRNILGESSVTISGYEKTGSVGPYYVREEDGLYPFLQSIIIQNKVLEAVKTDVVEARLWDHVVEDGFPASQEEVYIEIVSYGGDTSGYQIAFNLHYTGKKVAGLYDVRTNAFYPH